MQTAQGALIALVHAVIVIGMAVTPFTSHDPHVLLVWLVLAMGIMLHWATNSNACVLVILETKLRGIPEDRGFIYRMLDPVFRLHTFVQDTTFQTVVWCAMLGLVWYTVRRLRVMNFSLHQMWREVVDKFGSRGTDHPTA